MMWATVFKSNNTRAGGDNTQMQAKRTNFSLWKTIWKVCPQFTQGISWAIGNGRKVRFQLDVWLNGYRPMVDHVIQAIPKEMRNQTMTDMHGYYGSAIEMGCFYQPYSVITSDGIGQLSTTNNGDGQRPNVWL